VLGKTKNAFILATALQRYTKLAMSTLKLIKSAGTGVLSMSSIQRISSILTKFERQRKKKTMKKWATLNLSLHFGSPNHELSLKLCFVFLVWTNWFPSKMMQCRLNHNLICLVPGPLSKLGLGTNSKLLINRPYTLDFCLKWPSAWVELLFIVDWRSCCSF
jgi:hypothetical protein